LTVTIPFGIVADKYGRKLVLCLNASAEVAFFILIGMIGMFLSLPLGSMRTMLRRNRVGYFYNIFPTRAYIFTAFLQLAGGGGKVVSAIIYSVVADIATPEERIRLFYYLEIAEYSTQLLAPGLSAILMGFGLWVPFGTGVAVAAIALGSVLCLPETMPTEKARKGGFLLSDDGQARAAGGNFEQRISRIPTRDPSELEVLLDRGSSTESKGPYFDRLYQAVVDWIPHPFAKLKPGSESQLLVQFAVMLIWSIAWSSNLLLQQYSSKKIGWTIAQVMPTVMMWECSVKANVLPLVELYHIVQSTHQYFAILLPAPFHSPKFCC
jgi:MFS family permease